MFKKVLKGILFTGFLVFSLTVFAQNLNVSLVGSLQYSEDANDIWGYIDPATNIEYAIVGLRNGTSVVSLDNPANPVQVGYVGGASSTWRDIKTWGNFAYVTTDVGADGLGNSYITHNALQSTTSYDTTDFVNLTFSFDC